VQHRRATTTIAGDIDLMCLYKNSHPSVMTVIIQQQRVGSIVFHKLQEKLLAIVIYIMCMHIELHKLTYWSKILPME